MFDEYGLSVVVRLVGEYRESWVVEVFHRDDPATPVLSWRYEYKSDAYAKQADALFAARTKLFGSRPI